MIPTTKMISLCNKGQNTSTDVLATHYIYTYIHLDLDLLGVGSVLKTMIDSISNNILCIPVLVSPIKRTSSA